jgi:hypothetical protein
MGVTEWLVRVGFSRPHVLLAPAPGGTRTRVALERLARERGWPLAASPADADLVVVCGQAHGWLAEAVEQTWSQVPAPRCLVRVIEPGAVAQQLTTAASALLDFDKQRSMLPASLEPAQTSGHDMSGHDMGRHDMGGHGGHMHGGEVAGLSMADRAPDRDGLMLDQLHVPLGPFLPAWPAGLRLRLSLQGDVVQAVEVDALSGSGGSGPAFWSTPGYERAALLDRLAALLSVAGADGLALAAARLRDAELAGDVPLAGVSRLVRRLRRSRLLRRATDGVGVLAGADATDRWLRWLAAVEPGDAVRVDTAGLLPRLPELLAGQELASARLAIASLGLDLDTVGADRSAPAAVDGGGHHHD